MFLLVVAINRFYGKDRERRSIEKYAHNKRDTVYLFINRGCTSLKALHMENGGLVIYYLKLERGSFTLPSMEENGRAHPFSWENLMLMVQGIDPGKCGMKKRWEPASINSF